MGRVQGATRPLERVLHVAILLSAICASALLDTPRVAFRVPSVRQTTTQSLLRKLVQLVALQGQTQNNDALYSCSAGAHQK